MVKNMYIFNNIFHTYSQMFSVLDINGDGVLSSEDVAHPRFEERVKARVMRFPVQRFKKYFHDKNEAKMNQNRYL